MSLAQFFRILFARRLIILSCVVLGLAIAAATCMILKPRFPAAARVLMDVIKPDPVSGQVISSGFVRGYTKTQTELITDYRVAGDVVDRLGWDKNPALLADYQKNNDGTSDFRRYEAKKIIEATDANLVEGSNILEITYYSGNPILAKNVVTALRAAFIDASLRFKTDAAGKSAEWYVDQANKAQAALAAAETRKSDFERVNGIVMAPGGADSETMKLESMQGALLAARNSAGMIDSIRGPSPAAEALRGQLNSIDDALLQASQRLGPSHPAVIGLNERRKVVEQQLAREMSGASSARPAGASAAANASRLEGELEAQKAKVMALKPTLNQLGQLQREVDLRKSQYERAAARTADLKLEADVSDTGLVSLGDAYVSGSPTWPNKPLIMALGLFGGLIAGIVGGIAAELLSRRVRGPEDLAHAANAAVLAVIADTAAVPLRRRLRRLLGREDAVVGLQAAE